MNKSDWKHLLADPGPNGHIVQLYQDPDFYGEAISHFAAEGFVRGESVILVATDDNWRNISSRLETKGFHVDELSDRGQLVFLDANETLPNFMKHGMPDGTVFKPLARSTIERARQGGTYAGVRWWGEMVNVLYVEGSGQASVRLEQFFDEVAHEAEIPVFCSFLMDKYDAHIYDEAFSNICKAHSHLVPAADFAAHREHLSKAMVDVLGPVRDEMMHSIVSWNLYDCRMPISQQAVLWVRDRFPEQFGEVLERARDYERAARGQGLE